MGNFLRTIQHIQGHQDKHKKYDDLSLPAKMNTDADLLAVEYWVLNKKTTRKVIQLPVNTVQLHTNGATVNSNFFEAEKFSYRRSSSAVYSKEKTMV
eukprot:2479032-Ditylum_brightwellii.AAC.1